MFGKLIAYPLVLISFSIMSVYGLELQPNETLIQVRGTAVVPPCYINSDIDVDIDFGVSGTGSIKGGRKYVERWIPIQCEDQDAAWSVKIWGMSISGDSNIIATDVTDLGISLSESTNKIPLNTFFKPSTENGLMLKSQLVTMGSFMEGYEGEFNASVTITAKYD